MSLPNRYDLTIYAGKTLKRWWRLRYPDGSVVNLASTGYTTGRLTVAPAYGEPPVLDLTTDNGGLVIDYGPDANGAYWTGYLYASAAATAALSDWGDGVLEMEISDGLDVIPVLEGVATLVPDVTS